MAGVNGGWYWQALSVATALACGLLIGIERGWKLRDQKPGHARRRSSHLHHARARQRDRGAARASASARRRGAIAVGDGRDHGHRLLAPSFATTTIRPAPSPRSRPSRIGFLAGNGNPALAIACAAVSVALLALREELHGFVERLDADDVKALARYAVIAGAVLPFLPNGHYGPLGAWNPQRLWLVVVLVTGFSFLGYVANRIFGERNGTIATALIGGAYSSTAVTQSLAQRLGSEGARRRRAGGNRACHRGHVPARAAARRDPRDARAARRSRS